MVYLEKSSMKPIKTRNLLCFNARKTWEPPKPKSEQLDVPCAPHSMTCTPKFSRTWTSSSTLSAIETLVQMQSWSNTAFQPHLIVQLGRCPIQSSKSTLTTHAALGMPCKGCRQKQLAALRKGTHICVITDFHSSGFECPQNGGRFQSLKPSTQVLQFCVWATVQWVSLLHSDLVICLVTKSRKVINNRCLSQSHFGRHHFYVLDVSVRENIHCPWANGTCLSEVHPT